MKFEFSESDCGTIADALVELCDQLKIAEFVGLGSPGNKSKWMRTLMLTKRFAEQWQAGREGGPEKCGAPYYEPTGATCYRAKGHPVDDGIGHRARYDDLNADGSIITRTGQWSGTIEPDPKPGVEVWGPATAGRMVSATIAPDPAPGYRAPVTGPLCPECQAEIGFTDGKIKTHPRGDGFGTCPASGRTPEGF